MIGNNYPQAHHLKQKPGPYQPPAQITSNLPIACIPTSARFMAYTLWSTLCVFFFFSVNLCFNYMYMFYSQLDFSFIFNVGMRLLYLVFFGMFISLNILVKLVLLYVVVQLFLNAKTGHHVICWIISRHSPSDRHLEHSMFLQL